MSFLKKSAFLLIALLYFSVQAQKVILGGGQSPQIKISTSDQWHPEFWKDSAYARTVFDGSGLNYDLFNASRFLYQATLGSAEDEIKRTASMGFAPWIDEQLKLKPSNMTSQYDQVIDEVIDWFYLNGGDSTEQPDYFWAVHFNYAWWQMNLTNRDKLRQRGALALSEIFVVSGNGDLGGYGRAMANYYDVLIHNSFGNFRDLLREVTLHPAMGSYLSHLNNPKTDTIENIRPDENYAREIMQLFTIGLYELNLDGTHKKDSLGNSIPTYDQKDIQEFAKIFTGLSFSEIMPNRWIDTPQFGVTLYLGIPTKPMRMFDAWHEPGSKYLLNGFVTPRRQDGMKDIDNAIDNLFNHANTPPFICKQLIQRLIKSNPSPEYVERIARVFINDGTGVRGNLAAVVKAILLDEEARDCDWSLDPNNGQLREPMIRYSHFMNAIGVEQYYGRLWNSGFDFLDNTGQHVLQAPTVFNFYFPNFAPKGSISAKNLSAPEFQIHNSRTSIGFLNQVNNWIMDYVMYSWEANDVPTILLTKELEELARDPEALVNRIDILLTHGNLSDRSREIIKNAVSRMRSGNYRNDRARLALYLVMMSPDYAIFK